MKKLFFVLPVFILTACVGNNTSDYISQTNQSTALEEQAIVDADKEVGIKCAKGRPPERIPRSQFVKFHECATEIFESHVLPAAPFPELFMKFRASTLDNAQAYQDGKISFAQVKARSKIAWVDYLDARQAKANGVIQHLDAVDAAERAQLRDALASMPKTTYTTCNTSSGFGGSTTSCTSR